MQYRNNKLFYSPSDLITFMGSPFASYMERKKLDDQSLRNLMDDEDPMLKSLQNKGYAHEDEFLEELKNDGRSIEVINSADPEVMLDQTRVAMAAGVEVIAQAYLSLDDFGGMADFLIKIPGKSNFGDYHYEVWDAKLSKKLKPYFAIQLCCYSEMLELEQGVRPESMVVVLGNKEQKRLNVREYFAYYIALKQSFLQSETDFDPDELPDPAHSTAHGRWSVYAQELFEKRDHLSLVANISSTQIKRLESAGICTATELAMTGETFVPKLDGGILARLKDQARVQMNSKGLEIPKFEVLPHEKGVARGLALLPEHSDADIFFDIEGYPLVDGGLEYLWGATYFDANGDRVFRDFWAHDSAQEKLAFSEFIMWVFERWQCNPNMHVYHYAAYEITAIRKLMGRHGICEYEVDTLLRNHVFVDLYNVVRHGLIIGEPRYSIKNVEHIYRGKRETDVASGSESIVVYEEWLSNPDGDSWENSAVLKSIRDYNIDDCDSTQELASWLRELKIEHKIEFTGPEGKGEEEPTEAVTLITEMRDNILSFSDPLPDPEKRRITRNLAWMLEFHNRENKPTWWRLFDRLGSDEMDLYDDMDCLVGLERTSAPAFLPTRRSKNKVYEYSFDKNQPFKGQAKGFYVLGEENWKIKCNDYRPDEGIIALQSKDELPQQLSIIPDEFVNPRPIPEAIVYVVNQLLESELAQCAISDFLLRRKPRFITGHKDPIADAELDNKDFLDAVILAAGLLDNSYLCIQGPPGAGKTYTAKHIIGDLLSKGKRVGISSNSHKAILNLMKGVDSHIAENKIPGHLIKVGGDEADPIFETSNIQHRSNAKSCIDEASRASVCIGGTAWFFANSVFAAPEEGDEELEPFDYLFIDEAGQVSIANLIGMSRSCKNIILMGDQMQLGQPIQGSHPDDSGQSILEYLIQDHAAIPSDMGVFLPKTFRMHSDICEIISDQVYENRLHSDASANRHTVDVSGPIITEKSGIQFVPVAHEGNTQGSEEECAVISDIANELLGSHYWPALVGGDLRVIGWDDILFVAPYNYQVNLLKAALGPQANVGSVDKFQGQEAPIVILSMCTSNASESPRGIDFLFSKNRLNVALSRAQAIAIVVGSPDLANTEVNNIRQMELVNFFARITQIVSAE